MAAKPVYEDDAMSLSGFRRTSQSENDYPDQLTPLQSLGLSPGRKFETPDWDLWDSCLGVDDRLLQQRRRNAVAGYRMS
jgi:hypothetical protein